MMVSSKGRYALQVIMDIAKNEGDGYVSVADISERQHLPLKYLEVIVGILNKGGMLSSLRGKNGGYRLNKAPDEYSISEILNLTEGSLAPVECVKGHTAGCENAATCMTLPLWIGLDRVIEDYLSNISLQDVVDGNIKDF